MLFSAKSLLLALLTLGASRDTNALEGDRYLRGDSATKYVSYLHPPCFLSKLGWIQVPHSVFLISSKMTGSGSWQVWEVSLEHQSRRQQDDLESRPQEYWRTGGSKWNHGWNYFFELSPTPTVDKLLGFVWYWRHCLWRSCHRWPLWSVFCLRSCQWITTTIRKYRPVRCRRAS